MFKDDDKLALVCETGYSKVLFKKLIFLGVDVVNGQIKYLDDYMAVEKSITRLYTCTDSWLLLSVISRRVLLTHELICSHCL